MTPDLITYIMVGLSLFAALLSLGGVIASAYIRYWSYVILMSLFLGVNVCWTFYWWELLQ